MPASFDQHAKIFSQKAQALSSSGGTDSSTLRKLSPEEVASKLQQLSISGSLQEQQEILNLLDRLSAKEKQEVRTILKSKYAVEVASAEQDVCAPITAHGNRSQSLESPSISQSGETKKPKQIVAMGSNLATPGRTYFDKFESKISALGNPETIEERIFILHSTLSFELEKRDACTKTFNFIFPHGQAMAKHKRALERVYAQSIKEPEVLTHEKPLIDFFKLARGDIQAYRLAKKSFCKIFAAICGAVLFAFFFILMSLGAFDFWASIFCSGLLAAGLSILIFRYHLYYLGDGSEIISDLQNRRRLKRALHASRRLKSARKIANEA